ncbi:pyridoxamine 5'-phosphate oxidase family protein [Eubacteriales bacterium OttesenSCG-928-K08]|nr:pyridoxamine 5'-phosphate oxidase family protein [Eubacteriales bacterium OttesenSCG-928-K08]
MRRKDRELTSELTLEIVDKCPYVSLATINEDGSPYCMPIQMVRQNMALYFHCAKQGKKLDNLRARPEVSLSCVTVAQTAEQDFTTYYESAIVNGTAVEVVDENEKINALRILSERYTPQLMDIFDDYLPKYFKSAGVWRIDITTITGKANRKPE